MESFAKSASYLLDATFPPASIGPDAVFYDWGTGLDHPWRRRHFDIIAAMWGRATT
jgi:hypothetical protein